MSLPITFKALNSALWFSTTLFSWTQWAVLGTPETPELRLARLNQQRLDHLESKIDQLWAIESGMSKPTPPQESFVCITPDGSGQQSTQDGSGNQITQDGSGQQIPPDRNMSPNNMKHENNDV
jgi:hypothetical protein